MFIIIMIIYYNHNPKGPKGTLYNRSKDDRGRSKVLFVKTKHLPDTMRRALLLWRVSPV